MTLIKWDDPLFFSMSHKLTQHTTFTIQITVISLWSDKLKLKSLNLAAWHSWVAGLTAKWLMPVSCECEPHQKAPVVSLSKKLYSHCLVLVGSRNDLSWIYISQKNACFSIKLKLKKSKPIVFWFIFRITWTQGEKTKGYVLFYS